MRAPSTAVRLAFGAVLLFLLLAAGGTAYAEVIYELAANTGAGATDNVRATADGNMHTSSGFGTAGGALRLRYRGARSEASVGYLLALTRYVGALARNNTAHQLALSSSFTLSARWTLALGANGMLASTTNIESVDPSAPSAQPNVAGSALFLRTMASQSLSFQPTPRQSFGQSLAAQVMRWLEVPTGAVIPDTMVVTLGLSGSRQVGRDTFSGNLTVADAYAEEIPESGRGIFAQGHTFIGRGLAGWNRELSPTWTTQVQAGPSVILKLDGSGVLAPSAVLGLNYMQQPWFASITAMQMPLPNLYLGGATLNDQIMLRLALALTRNERLFVGANGGYVYARFPDDQSNVRRAYDQFVGGLSLTYRVGTSPLAAVLSYFVVSQRGSQLPDYAVDDLARQAVFLHLRGDFAFGPGTPPLFGGAL